MFIEIDEVAQKVLAERAAGEQPDKSGGRKKIPAAWLTISADTEVTVRLLPPWTTEGHYAYSPYIQINQHWKVGVDEKRLVCPENTPHSEDKRCFVCEQCKALFASGDKGDEKRARRMYANKNFIYQVIDRAEPVWSDSDEKISENPELIGKPKVKFMRLPWGGHRQVTDIISDSEYGNITSVRNGRDIKIKRMGSGMNTEYGIMARPKQSPLFDHESLIEALGSLLNRLDEHPFFRVATYDETQATYLGLEVPRDSKPLLASGGSTPPVQKALGGSDSRYVQWAAGMDKEIDETGSLVILDRSGLAEKMGWTDEDVPRCYGVEPDHLDKDCLRCPAKKYCGPFFANTKGDGQFSIKAPVVTTPKGFGKGFGKSSPADDNLDDIPF